MVTGIWKSNILYLTTGLSFTVELLKSIKMASAVMRSLLSRIPTPSLEMLRCFR
jgi:hypothetical protein